MKDYKYSISDMRKRQIKRSLKKNTKNRFVLPIALVWVLGFVVWSIEVFAG